MNNSSFAEIALEKTFIKKIGNGSPVIVVNGGPGFSSNYILDSLNFLEHRYNITFYDQPGCGATPQIFDELSLNSTAKHLSYIIKEATRNEPATIIAHSYGCIVFLKAMRIIGDDSCLHKVILLNPMPWLAHHYGVIAESSYNNLTDNERHNFHKYFEESNADKIMEILLPYYTPNEHTLTADSFQLNLETYSAVNRTLIDFDLSNEFSLLKDYLIILGDLDFIQPDHIKPLLNTYDHLHIMKDVGHFPFYEKPDEFRTLIGAYLAQ